MPLPRYIFISSALMLTNFVNVVFADICNTKQEITNDDFKISCSKFEFSLSFELNIFCKTENQWSNYPREKLIARMYNVVFENCTFPTNLNLQNITTSMGVGNIIILKFVTSSSTLRREHLKDFTVHSLHLIDPNFTGLLPSDLLYDIKLNNFYISDSGISEIPANFFQNSTQLQCLHIFNSKIARFKFADFTELKNLEELIIFGNGITELEAGTFDNLLKLEILDISKNRLRSLTPGIFKHLVDLTTINLTGNDFDELPADLLQIENSKLEKVRLNYNRGGLSSLPKGFFKNLRHLRYVELIGNKFTSVPPELFNTTNDLNELWLTENLLESLPERLFEEANLEKLYLNHNQLTNLSAGVLIGLINLKIFEASHNKLTHIDYNLYKYMEHVEEVDLSYNQLTLNTLEMRLSIFTNCTAITRLNLAHNEVSQFFFDFNWGILEYLNLSNNNFSELTASDIDNFNVNIVIDLRNNNISRIDFKSLSDEVKKFENINCNNNVKSKNVTLYLEGNPLNCDCNILHFRHYLDGKSTDNLHLFVNVLGDNFLCAAPPDLKNTALMNVDPSKLSCLIPSGASNQICSHRVFPELDLLSIDCSHKNLTIIPPINNSDDRSVELLLSGNDFQITPSLNRSDLLRVTILDLSSNNISTVSRDVFSSSLRELKLHDNCITRLDNNVVKYLDNETTLRNLTLRNNKWICDCKARDFLNVIQKKLVLPQLQEILCSSTGQRLSSMTVNELCADAIVLIVSSIILISFFVVIVASAVALYYKHQEEIKVWLYSKNLCLWFVTEDELDKDKKYDAFISYSHKDEDFVIKEIVSKLEDGPNPFKLCLHYRDWLAGEWISDNIARSVNESRRTIVVLSPNFLESIWGRMEFHTAYSQTLKEGRVRVIIILYGQIQNIDDLDLELQAFLKTSTYLKWGDPWFFDKLKFALPHRYEGHQKRRTRNSRLIAKHLSQLPTSSDGVNDTLESIAMPKVIRKSNNSIKLLGSTVAEDVRNANSS